MPDEKTTLHKIVSLIVKLCYEQLVDLAQRQCKNALPIRVNFLLDEFSNLPAIPDMPAMISAARSRNIKFHLIIQGLYQLSSKYGADDAQTIKGNCGNWAFLTSRELPLLQEISDLCGQDALTGQRLITVSQLQRLNKERGEVLILLGRQSPYIAHLADISEYVLPPSHLRQYPYITPNQLPSRTIREIMAQIHSNESKQKPPIHDMLADIVDKQSSNTSDEPADEYDLLKALDRKMDELFGLKKSASSNLDDDSNDEDTP